MSAWNPEIYLQFEKERTLPCKDLVSRIELESPSSIADLGCGPGNSTAVIEEKWPKAELLGIDNSPEMLEKARLSKVRAEWLRADILHWKPEKTFDLIFSNAALQWVPDHETTIPRLFSFVKSGGALAFQMPTRTDLWSDVLERLRQSSSWKDRFHSASSEFYSHEPRSYYDLLSGSSRKIDLWETKYYHVLPNAAAVVEWTKGTALRPLLDQLPDSKTREAFIREYTLELTRAYPAHPDGKLLFPFLRRFVVAYR